MAPRRTHRAGPRLAMERPRASTAESGRPVSAKAVGSPRALGSSRCRRGTNSVEVENIIHIKAVTKSRADPASVLALSSGDSHVGQGTIWAS
jgi:hypothetical protein